MPCQLTKGLSRNGCRLRGGIRMAYVKIKNDPAAATELNVTIVDNEITSLHNNATNEIRLYELQNLHGIGSAIETFEGSEENNAGYFNQVVSLNARGFDNERLLTFEELIKSTCQLIVHYESGISRLFGLDFFMDATSGENSSGEAAGDANSMRLEFTGMEIQSAKIISGSTLDSPLGDISPDEYTIVHPDGSTTP